MKCGIIRDLLPSYIDKLTCEDSNQEVEKHLENCPDCKKIYQQMLPAGSPFMQTEEEKQQDLQVLKSFERLRRRVIAIVIVAVVAAVSLYTIISYMGMSASIPYDKIQIEAEISAQTTYYFTEEGIKIYWHGIHVDAYYPESVSSTGVLFDKKTISVDGEEKIYAFVTATTSGIMNHMIINRCDTSEPTRETGFVWNGIDFEEDDLAAIYYLDRGFLRLEAKSDEEVSDEEIFALIEKNGHLIWSADE